MDITYTVNELPEVAGKVLSNVSNKTLLFYGEIGVGKTTLIKELARKLGVTETISSPTYSIVNEYDLENDRVYHFDCYRLEQEDEALDIGIEEYFNRSHWNLIEWPEKINSFLPIEKTSIRLTKNINGSRTLNIMPLN